MSSAETEKRPRVVDAHFVAGAKSSGELPPPVSVEVAFAGRSNVGKSSLLNSLMERRNLVRTSSTPGCTRQISFFEARTSDGFGTTLVDLPGYGYAKRSKVERKAWADLIEGYLLTRPSLALVVVLVDVRRGVEEDDRELLELLAEPAKNRRPVTTLLVATKLDKLPASQKKLALDKLKKSAGLPVIGFSAKDGTGRDAVWRRIRSALTA
ncbi:MAG: ribosome biogenesis GTP-binding protein YsxC [Myxococcales bacterium]|nr:ribosome biogenesis GTP-binding protein YsxC [Myxococcales bacterium]MCB9577575.1 ribosome biogenesis GTP-binding protein YsxC [Polyangiaceae bacterium]